MRARVLAARRAIPLELNAAMSRAIAERVLVLEPYREAATIHIYIGAIKGEVATRDLVRESLSRGKRVLCPRVARGPLRLESYEIGSLDDLAPGTRGLWEPDPSRARRASDSEIDLAIVPGVAFDRFGHRIGFGAGFYDRFLSSLEAPILALAFSLQVVSRVSHAQRDIPVDWIVTESMTIDCRAARQSLGRNS